MTIVSKGNALAALPHGKSGIVVQQLGRWVGSIFQRVSAQLMKALLRLKSLHELNQLNGDMLRDIGLTRVNLPGVAPGFPGLPGGTTGRFIRWSSLEQWSD
jgi:hypothetical protein